jgi:hypothetical protein
MAAFMFGLEDCLLFKVYYASLKVLSPGTLDG